LFEDSPRILKETSRTTNGSRRSLPSSSSSKRKSGDYTSHSRPNTLSRAESTGILDKLKNDIDSLDIMKNLSYVDESSSTVFSGSVFDFDDENKTIGSSSKSVVSLPFQRTYSLDNRTHRREELRGPLAVNAMSQAGNDRRRGNAGKGSSDRRHSSGAASVGSHRDMNRKHDELRTKLQKEKEEMQKRQRMERNDNRDNLQSQLSLKDEKIEKLEKTIHGLKKEVITERDENERRESKLLELKSQLDECRAKETDTQSVLREVMKNVDHERGVREKEMHLVSKVQQAEVMVLEEKLAETQKESSVKMEALREEISEKTRTVDALKRDINQLRSKLDNSSKSKADSEKTLRSQIERLELRLDNDTDAHQKKVAELSEMQKSSDEAWAAKLRHMEDRLEEQHAREAAWTDELSVTKLQLENLRAFSATLENQNQYLKESSEGMQKLQQEYEELQQYKVESDQIIDDLKQELEAVSDAKNSLLDKSNDLTLQVENMNKSMKERDAYMSGMENNLDQLENEKYEANAKMEQLQNMLAQVQSKCELSTQEASDAKAQLDDATFKIEKYMNEGRMLNKQVSDLESENTKLAAALTTAEAKIKQEIDDHHATVASHERDMIDMSKASDILEGKISEMQHEIRSYQEKLGKVSKLEATTNDLRASLAHSEEKCSNLQSNVKSLNTKLEESEQSYNRLDTKYKALVREQSDLEERERSYATNASKRETEQINTIHRLRKEKHDISEQLEKIKEEAAKANRNLARTMEESKKGKVQLRTALKSLDEMMKYIDSMKDESDEMMKDLESENEALMKRLGVMEKHREFDQQTIKLHEDEKQEHARQIKAEIQKKTGEELNKIKSEHERELQDVKSRYECRISELQSTITQKFDFAKSLQEHGSSEVNNLIKKVGEITEKHSRDLRSLREKHEAELAEEIAAKNTLRTTLRELESKKDELEDALKLAEAKSAKSYPGECKNCDNIGKSLKEKEQAFDELKVKLHEQSKNESKLRGELAQNKQLISITKANEKLLEDHITSLEVQIDTLVADYEAKLGNVK